MTTEVPPAEVAVAIVSFNTRNLLERCLQSLEPDVRRGLAEVWVVDNGSADGSPELVREGFAWATLLEPGNIGFGPAVNRVAAVTESRWLACANADIELPADALRDLLQAGAAHPEAGAIAPRLIFPDGSTQHSVHAFPSVALALADCIGADRVSRRLRERWMLGDGWNPDRARVVDWALGAFLLIRRDGWDAIGGFDERQWMYAEDLDLGWRLARAGRPTRYEPGTPVRHVSSASTEQFFSDVTERWVWSTYAWLLRRRGWMTARTIALLNITGSAVRALLLSLLSWARPDRFSARSAFRWTRLHAIGLRPRRELERHR